MNEVALIARKRHRDHTYGYVYAIDANTESVMVGRQCVCRYNPNVKWIVTGYEEKDASGSVFEVMRAGRSIGVTPQDFRTDGAWRMCKQGDLL